MRISLGETGNKRQARPKRLFARGRSRTFESSVALPAEQRRRRSQRESPPKRRTRTAAQAQALAPQAEARSAGTRRLHWSGLLARWPALLLFGLLVAATVYGSVDSRFYVYEAEIVGARHLTADAIYQASGVDKQSIFWIDAQQVARRIVGLEGVRTVHVRCSLPAAVRIEVVEREPVVLWRVLAQKRDWWLDEQGVVLPYHGDPSLEGTVFVVDSSERQLRAGDRIEPKGLVESVIRMAGALSGARVFYYQAERGLSFIQQSSAGQWPVYVGTGEDLEHKIQVVEVLTEYLVAKSIRPSYVDVRWADRPLYGVPGAKSSGGGQ